MFSSKLGLCSNATWRTQCFRLGIFDWFIRRHHFLATVFSEDVKECCVRGERCQQVRRGRRDDGEAGEYVNVRKASLGGEVVEEWVLHFAECHGSSTYWS